MHLLVRGTLLSIFAALMVLLWSPSQVMSFQPSLLMGQPRMSRKVDRSSSTHLFQKSFFNEDGSYDKDGIPMHDDDEDVDEDYLPDVDTSKFQAPKASYGLKRGRSPPAQRKAMGKSGRAQVHVCSNCGAEFVKWMGRCPTCREWNTLQAFTVQRTEQPSAAKARPSFMSSTSSSSSSWLAGTQHEEEAWNNNHNNNDFINQPVRVTDVYQSNNAPSSSKQRTVIPTDDEFNRVLGGGIMSGSLTLIGGDPGVGKSTLLLQIASAMASLATPSVGIGMGQQQRPPDDHGGEHNNVKIGPVWYMSGEENPDQIASRAERLGIQESELWLLSETHVDTLCEQVVASYHPTTTTTTTTTAAEQLQLQQASPPLPPSLLICDSIQTLLCEAGGTSAPGGVTQVRECVALLLRLAKSTNIPVLLVGHVTKDGSVAGPRTVEHMVDCVLYLEGGNHRTIGGVNLRMLRAAKNRFGSADEVGVYEMTSGRLLPVSDPSSLFLSNRLEYEDSEGCAITVVLEGLRAMTVEIQALVTANFEGHARRTVDGLAFSRLALLLGVLQKRCGMYFAKQDVYINVVGNIQLDGKGEGSGSDLAVSLALVSSLLTIPVRSDTAFVGEVGLLGELRPVPALEKRLQEAQRMGFSRIITPRALNSNIPRGTGINVSRMQGVDWIQCDTLKEALNEGLIRQLPKRQRRRVDDSSPAKQSTSHPGGINELMLGEEEVIVDEEDDNTRYPFS